MQNVYFSIYNRKIITSVQQVRLKNLKKNKKISKKVLTVIYYDDIVLLVLETRTNSNEKTSKKVVDKEKQL